MTTMRLVSKEDAQEFLTTAREIMRNIDENRLSSAKSSMIDLMRFVHAAKNRRLLQFASYVFDGDIRNSGASNIAKTRNIVEKMIEKVVEGRSVSDDPRPQDEVEMEISDMAVKDGHKKVVYRVVEVLQDGDEKTVKAVVFNFNGEKSLGETPILMVVMGSEKWSSFCLDPSRKPHLRFVA